MRGKVGALCALVAACCGGTGAEGAICKVGALAQFEVTMVGRAPTTMLTINGKPARFIVDSGAWWSVITQGSAVDFGLHPTPASSYLQLSGIGGKAKTEIVTVALGVGKTSVPNVTFLVTPNELEGAGVLGQNVLGIVDAEYDLAGGAVRLMKATDCSKANLAYWAGDKPFSMMTITPSALGTEHTEGMVIVNGARLTATFDTGAATTLMSLTAARHAHIDIAGPDVKEGGYTSGFGPKTVHTWIVPVASLAIGNEELKNVHIRVADTQMVDLLIGADFFLSHRVYVANSLNKMFFTYNGGPVFDTGVIPKGAEAAMNAPAAAAEASNDAGALYRRATLREAQQDFPGALADLDRAVALAPEEETYVRDRGRLHMYQKQLHEARADLDKALTLKPDDPIALVGRAHLAHEDGDDAQARADLDAAARAATPAAGERLVIGALDTELGRYDHAIAQYDQWLATHPGDIATPAVLNSRCWVRALAGRELDKALVDCNAALKTVPGDADTLDSRGLVELKWGRFDAAIADYDAALKANPRLAWSLYCRGLAKRGKGDKVGGDADVDAALKMTPTLAERAHRSGLD